MTHDSLADFLHARLAEDEQAARAAEAANGSPWEARAGMVRGRPASEPTWPPGLDGDLWDCERSDSLTMHVDTAAHIARHDPARVLAEVEAKRRLVALYQREADTDHQWEQRDIGVEEGLESALRYLALPYAGHPAYRADWAP